MSTDSCSLKGDGLEFFSQINILKERDKVLTLTFKEKLEHFRKSYERVREIRQARKRREWGQ